MTQPQDMIISYRILRRFLGCLGLALPVALLLGGLVSEFCVRPTISGYYYSSSPLLRDIFVGTLVAIGVFLVCYKGHKKKGKFLEDNLIATIAGIGAFGIALFPTEPSSQVECWCQCVGDQITNQATGAKKTLSWIHDGSALVFFGAVAALAWFQFARSAKKKRNTIYRVCAVLIGVLIVPIIIDSHTDWIPLDSDRYSMVFGLEALAVWVFGAAWLVKGWGRK